MKQLVVKRFYIRELDGLRFIAFLLIFIHHTDFTDFFLLNFLKEIGWLGVDIFFCLSAFLLTKLLCIEHKETGAVNILNFFMRRILRIWPLYFSYVFIAFFLSGYMDPVNTKTWWRAIGLLTFTDNLFAAAQGYNPIQFTGHLWTISYEEQFYILLPFVILFFVKNSLRIRNLVLMILAAIGTFIRLIFIFQHVNHPAIWVLPITHFESIAAGMFIAFNDNNPSRISHTLSYILFFISLSVIIILPGNGVTSFHLLLLYPFIGIASGSALNIALHSKSWVNRILTSEVIVYLGKISFGLYVFHNLSFTLTDQFLRQAQINIDGLNILISFILTILIASLSYTFLEKRFLFMKKRFTLILSRPE